MIFELETVKFEINLDKVSRYEIHGIGVGFDDIKYATIEYLINSDSIAGYIRFIDDSKSQPFYDIYYYNFKENLFDKFLLWNGWKIKKTSSIFFPINYPDYTYQVICPKGQTENYHLYSSGSTIADDFNKVYPNIKFRELKFIQIVSSFPDLKSLQLAFEKNNWEISNLDKERRPENVLTPILNSVIDHPIQFSVLSNLQNLVGLKEVKDEIDTLIKQVQIRKQKLEKGITVIPSTLHLVFTGNPGTGKTSVARIIAKAYKELGILKKDYLVETSRPEIVGQYVGHTAPKMKSIFESALMEFCLLMKHIPFIKRIVMILAKKQSTLCLS